MHERLEVFILAQLILSLIMFHNVAAATRIVFYVLSGSCCPSILVSAREAIETEQAALLGRYDLNGTHNGRPVYLRRVDELDLYFFYKENGTRSKRHWHMQIIPSTNRETQLANEESESEIHLGKMELELY
jgi:hypothetical protein